MAIHVRAGIDIRSWKKTQGVNMRKLTVAAFPDEGGIEETQQGYILSL